MIPIRRLALAAACALTSAACGSGGSVGPDEFRVVTKPPLVVPPEFNVRPPKAGEASAQDLDASAMARRSVLGVEYESRASDAEQLLVAKAGAAQADPVIRDRIDLEAGGIVRKSPSFADRLIFWNDGDTYVTTDVDADREAERLRRVAAADAATGEGAQVVIRRRTGLKLPGL